MIDRGHLEAYLAGVTQRSGARDAQVTLMRWMCRCLSLVQHLLPETGQKALTLATSFWLVGVGAAEGLLAARVACWNYLAVKGRGTEVQDAEDAAMRAVICVLYAESESDEFSVETARWFADMFDQLGLFSKEVTELMTA